FSRKQPYWNCKMLMPKKNRVAIYEHLFKEGVMVAKKDFNAPKHPELESVPNLHVIKALQSLKSRGMVTEQPRPKAEGGADRRGGDRADRDQYRRGGAPGGDKKAEVGAGADPSFQFRGGFGRGRPQQQ
ncbi:unnamed protein product, partial [Owenia fusiformis]